MNRTKRIWVAVALAAGVLIGGAAHVGARQAHPTKAPIHVVRAGETLWSIVREAYPSTDPREAISRLQRANHLGGAGVHPGQRLKLPPR